MLNYVFRGIVELDNEPPLTSLEKRTKIFTSRFLYVSHPIRFYMSAVDYEVKNRRM